MTNAHPNPQTQNGSAPDGDDPELLEPNIRIYGPIGDGTVWSVLDRLDEIRKTDDAIVLELTTQGGDADAALRIALEIRLFRQKFRRKACFVGKTSVMSAGITIMSAFPSECRYLTDDTVLLIHERRMTKTLQLDGPMGSSRQILREQLALVESAERVERETFGFLAEGSNLSEEEIYDRARNNFYLTAEEAKKVGLVGTIISTKS